jgi:hypothetical protein
MSQKPPYEPNPEERSQDTARQRIEALYHLTQDILAKSTAPYLPEFSQLILKRGRLVDEIRLLNLQHCPKDEQAHLIQLLLECKQLDQRIEQNMKNFRSDAAEQMRSLKDAKALLKKYQLPEQGISGTHSTNA